MSYPLLKLRCGVVAENEIAARVRPLVAWSAGMHVYVHLQLQRVACLCGPQKVGTVPVFCFKFAGIVVSR